MDEFDQTLHCECGKDPDQIIKCNDERCSAEWIPVIYVDPDWPNEKETEKEA